MNNCELDERRRRLVVPIKNDDTKERFRKWLLTNAQFWSAEIRVFSILEPLWFKSIPYSATQAHRLLNEQNSITAKANQDLAIYCQELRNSFGDLCLSSEVTVGHINAAAICAYANNWKADCILLLSTKKGTLRELLQLDLTAQVLRSADCLVHVVQTTTNQKIPHKTNHKKPLKNVIHAGLEEKI